MGGRRQNPVIHEIEPVTEVEFPSPLVAAEPAPDRLAPDTFETAQLLWERRRWLSRVAAWAFVISSIIAFLIPNQYESSVSIMPPDSMNNAGTMLAALAGKANPEMAAMAGSLLGMKGSGALYVGLFRSRSVQDRVVDRLNLQKVYWSRYKQDARKKLDSRTDVSEDRKSSVITLAVVDRSPQRARDLAQVYVDCLLYTSPLPISNSAWESRPCSADLVYLSRSAIFFGRTISTVSYTHLYCHGTASQV